MKLMPLTQGKFAMVDDEDFDYLSQWKWGISKGYATRKSYLGFIDGKHKRGFFSMHRVINKTLVGMDTDHINGDRLDNRKENLRSATRTENIFNRPKHKNSRSGYKGVNWRKDLKKWRAEIQFNGIRKTIGFFENIDDAVKAYDECAIQYHGKFAKINKI